MGIGYIIAGVVFLFNPMISTLDILPDFIGYLLILVGIYKIADITDKMKNIHRELLYLTGLSIFKTILLFVMTSDDQVLVLLFVFAFAIAETILMIPVFGKIFDGFEDVGIRHDGASMFTKISELRTLTYVFILIRALFTVIPEFRHLAATNYEGEISSYEMTGRIDYSYVLILLNILVVTMAGAIWLGMMISYLRRIRKDEEFLNRLNEYYINNILIDTNRFIVRRLAISMFLLMMGFVFLIDIFLDNVDVLPDFIGALFILSAVIVLQKDNPKNKILFSLVIVYIPLSLINWIYRIIFANNEYHVRNLQNAEVLSSYIALIAISFVASLVIIFILYYLKKLFTNMINSRVGFEYEEHFKTLIERQNQLIKKMNEKNTAIFIISIAFTFSKIVQTTLILLLPEYWMVHFFVQLVWIFNVYLFIREVYDEVKYRLDVGVEE